MKRALMFYGGWEGHTPKEVSEVFTKMLEKENFEVDCYDNLDCLDKDLKNYDLIVPIWTMGEISDKYVKNISEAVANGTALVGCHGGMCDSFRDNVNWQFMTGSQWVAHPNDIITYKVNLLENEFTKLIF